MNFSFRYTAAFKRDVKRLKRQRKNLEKLKTVLDNLSRGKKLNQRYRDHVLYGQYKGTRECHIEPDWLLIYKPTINEIILIRTGSHAELFR